MRTKEEVALVMEYYSELDRWLRGWSNHLPDGYDYKKNADNCLTAKQVLTWVLEEEITLPPSASYGVHEGFEGCPYIILEDGKLKRVKPAGMPFRPKRELRPGWWLVLITVGYVAAVFLVAELGHIFIDSTCSTWALERLTGWVR